MTLLALVFLAALCVQIWLRVSPAAQAQIIAKAQAMLNRSYEIVRNKLFRRRMSYKHLFLGPDGNLNVAGRIVMADLTKFCRGLTSTTVVSPKSGMVDPHATGIAEGRREVWLRIMKELNLDPAEAISAMKDEDALAA